MINDIINVFKNLPSNHLHHTFITFIIIIALLAIRYNVKNNNIHLLDIYLGFLPIIIELLFQIQSIINRGSKYDGDSRRNNYRRKNTIHRYFC